MLEVSKADRDTSLGFPSVHTSPRDTNQNPNNYVHKRVNAENAFTRSSVS